MSTAELGPQPADNAPAEAELVDGTGPIPSPGGLTKPGVEGVAAVPVVVPSQRASGRHAARVSYATGPIAVPDAALAAAAATNATAFAAIYRRYGDALHSFCLGMLRDPDAAADCVHDVFVTAATRLGQLREHDKLRPWLYAIARHEALRRLKHRRREQATDELPDTPDLTEGPDHDLSRRELTELVTAACSGLSDRERAVLELHYRQGLDGPALADALGVSATNANTLVGRLRGTVERSLAALLVARHQGDRCPELATVLASWDGQLTVLMRKRIARHIDHCSACTQARRDLVNPRALLASAPIAIPAPDWLEHHVLHSTTSLVESAVPAAGGVHAAAASWWPAGITAGSKTLVAVLAPVGAAAIALPIALVGLLGGPSETVTTTTVQADAPGALVTPSTRGTPRFGYDMPTTRLLPTDPRAERTPRNSQPNSSTPSSRLPAGSAEPPRMNPVQPPADGGAAAGGGATLGDPQDPDGPRTDAPNTIKPTDAPGVTKEETWPDIDPGSKGHTPPTTKHQRR